MSPPHAPDLDVYPHLKHLIETFAPVWRKRGLPVSIYDLRRGYTVILGDDKVMATIVHVPESLSSMLMSLRVEEHEMDMRPVVRDNADVGWALANIIALLDYHGADRFQRGRL